MTPPTPSAAASLEVTNESVQKPTPADGSKGSENRSPGRLAWMRFKRDRTGVISAYVVGFFFLVAAAAPLIAKLYGKNPYTVYADVRPELFDSAGVPVQPNGGISSEFWFGLEPGNGYDVFTKLIYGIRTSLMISVAVTLAVIV
ncbi:ABC transporter permease, partial [Streptomyces sp. NPDC051987]